ncbi:hypothetical protein [Brevundimonas vesicularis]|nr:hypothetical protein [Brevundimonas vesicularis]
MRRSWSNPAHRQIATWKLCLLGAVMGVTMMGLGELLLRLSA